ncbi:BH0177 [Halalkalibacterium halodurans C-125]|uniref:Uncharacterized protein BH0177 n=1 Tax=Halalkalibacterium halodurans (strain ATCC BAA-125 / DSM 18197 / FERM 7344 / JCM 9153 / C-125) TaxID=272558 RepID=Y177_HALH5|nr:hypothetical protein [Halalkalibacterium halodurans]Q9KGC7.1 RecName: Full=Uncharacterized protein BH0177 [Halalkalibacterium halodurans C-125]BAB03896.1 BH0177 [Halalkalibacterium halodurans C-125]
MKKRRSNLELLLQCFYRKKVYLSVFIVLALYCVNLLIENASSEKNVYDLLMQLTEFHPLTYTIIPTYLVVLTAHFSLGKMHHYLAFRCKDKRQWYNLNVSCIAIVTTGYSVLIAFIMLMQSLFVFRFENKWSTFAVDYYTYHATFLMNYSPLVYSIATLLLLWLLLFLLGLLFYVIFIWTKSPLVSLLFVFLLNIMNAAVTLGKIDTLTPVFFTDRVSIIQYVYKFDLNQDSFPYSIFVYWIMLIAVIYLIGWLVIQRVDFESEKGEKHHAS